MHAPGPALCRRSRGCLGARRARHGCLVCVSPCTCGSEVPHTKGQRRVGRGHCPHLSPRSHILAPDPAETEDFKFELGLQGHYQGTLVKVGKNILDIPFLCHETCQGLAVWPLRLRCPGLRVSGASVRGETPLYVEPPSSARVTPSSILPTFQLVTVYCP